VRHALSRRQQYAVNTPSMRRSLRLFFDRLPIAAILVSMLAD
jgi:hypothetical protein